MAEVIPIHGGDDGGIGDFTQGKKFADLHKPHFRRYIPEFSRFLQTVGAQFGDSRDFNTICVGPGAVNAAPGACSDNDVFHGYFSLFFSVYHGDSTNAMEEVTAISPDFRDLWT